MARHSTRRVVLLVVALIVLAGAGIGAYLATSGSNNKPGAVQGPHPLLMTVSGNRLVDSAGAPVRLIGVDLGGQYYCFDRQSPAAFDIPPTQASVQAIASWHVNAVRMIVNEDCWLGINGSPLHGTANDYRQQIEKFVAMFNAAKIETIIALVTGTPGTTGLEQKHGTSGTQVRKLPMADAAHSPAFWTSVAGTFKNASGVIFDLYNEPQDITWECWEHGCAIGGQKYVGMQQLVNAVRATGSHAPLMLGGVSFANNLTGWLAHEPTDPLHQLIASVHAYQAGHCNNAKCWRSTLKPVTQKVPLVTGEFGDSNCSTTYVGAFMRWADKTGVSYLSWAWATGTGCTQGGTLLASYSGTPSTPYGQFIQSHFEALYQAGHGDIGVPSATQGTGHKKKKKATSP